MASIHDETLDESGKTYGADVNPNDAEVMRTAMDFGQALGRPADLSEELAISILHEIVRSANSATSEGKHLAGAAAASTQISGVLNNLSSNISADQLRYRALVEQVPAVTFMAALDGKNHNFYISPQIQSLLGFTQEEWLADPFLWYSRLHSEDRAQWSNEFARTCATGVSFRSEYRLLARDGRVVWVQGECQLISDETGTPRFLLGIAFDITERKQAQAALTDMNQTLERRVGERTAELGEAHAKLVQIARQAGMADVATGVLHNVGNVLTSVNVSVSLAKEKLRTSRVDRLERVCQILDEHSSDLPDFLSRDAQGKMLPGYLTKLTSHLMAERKGLMTELEAMTEQVEHIKQLISSQQRFAKGDGFSEPTEVLRLVDNAVSMNSSALSRRGVTVERDIPALPTLVLDHHKVTQILVNLIRNAGEACSSVDRPDRRICVSVRRQKAGHIEFRVTDNGIGIPPENLTAIFSHGFTTRASGHGFGLHSAANAAGEMGGSLTVFSAGAGHGAAFTLSVPTKIHEPSAAVPRAA